MCSMIVRNFHLDPRIKAEEASGESGAVRGVGLVRCLGYSKAIEGLCALFLK